MKSLYLNKEESKKQKKLVWETQQITKYLK